MHILALFIAFLAGIAMAVQGSINAALGKIIGLLEATFIVHIVGTVIIVLSLYVFGLGRGNLGRLPAVPWYLYFGGLIWCTDYLRCCIQHPPPWRSHSYHSHYCGPGWYSTGH
jgi:uncharacterized membrane protein YdcZ (DUF606 family)